MNEDRETKKMLEYVEDKIEKKQLKFELIGKVLKVAGVLGESSNLKHIQAHIDIGLIVRNSNCRL